MVKFSPWVFSSVLFPPSAKKKKSMEKNNNTKMKKMTEASDSVSLLLAMALQCPQDGL